MIEYNFVAITILGNDSTAFIICRTMVLSHDCFHSASNWAHLLECAVFEVLLQFGAGEYSVGTIRVTRYFVLLYSHIADNPARITEIGGCAVGPKQCDF